MAAAARAATACCKELEYARQQQRQRQLQDLNRLLKQ